MLRKMIKIEEIPSEMVYVHSLENTDYLVIELVMFGYQYSSRYILTRRNNIVQLIRDQDPEVKNLLFKGGSGLGKILGESDFKFIDGIPFIEVP